MVSLQQCYHQEKKRKMMMILGLTPNALEKYPSGVISKYLGESVGLLGSSLILSHKFIIIWSHVFYLLSTFLSYLPSKSSRHCNFSPPFFSC